MQCPSCQAECDPQAVYCPRCGARIEPDQTKDPTLGPAEGGDDGAEATPRERFSQAAASRQSDGVEDESELWQGSFSKKAMVGQWIFAGLLTTVALIAGVLTDTVLWLLLAAAIVWLILGLWYGYRRLSVHYTLTSQRLIHESGMLWRTIDRVELIDIDDVTFKQGPVERMFRVGTIHISSSDITTPQLDLPGIDNVRHVADEIDDARRKERRRRGLHIEAI